MNRQIHDLGNFAAVALAQRSAENGEILGIQVNQPAINFPPPGDHSIAQRVIFIHAQPDRAVGHEPIYLSEGIFIQQVGDPFTRGFLSAGVLLLRLRFAAALNRGHAPVFENLL